MMDFVMEDSPQKANVYPRGQSVAVGVIGLGFGRRVLLPAFQSLEGCEVLSVCSLSEDKAFRVATESGIPDAYSDWRRMLEEAPVDAVVVALPPCLNHEVVISALEAGKHVFCEKPLAVRPHQAEGMLRAAEKARVAHMVDFVFAGVPAFLQAGEWISRVGRIQHVAVNWFAEASSRGKERSAWQNRLSAGGGALQMYVSHVFFYLEWLMGPIARIWSRLQYGSIEDSADVLCQLAIEFSSGASGSLIMGSHCYRGTGHRVEIFGEDGTVLLNNPTRDIMGFELNVLVPPRRSRKEENFRFGARQSNEDGRILAVRPLAERFVRWIRSGEASGPSFAEGLRVQCLIDATRRSAAEGTWVSV